MKKLICCLILAAAVSGCCDRYEFAERKNPSDRKVSYEQLGWIGTKCLSLVEIDGHTYVLAEGPQAISLAHAESCACRTKK